MDRTRKFYAHVAVNACMVQPPRDVTAGPSRDQELTELLSPFCLPACLCLAVDQPHDTVFQTQGFWRAPAAILAALESAVRAEFPWLGADAARSPGFGFMQGSALRCLSQLIPQFVISAHKLHRVAWGLARAEGISYTNKTRPGESSTGSDPASSQQEATNLEYPEAVKVTAALTSLLLSCLKVTGAMARHTSSPPQVTACHLMASETPITASLSCLGVAVLVTNREFTTVRDSTAEGSCMDHTVDSSSSSSSSSSSNTVGRSTALPETPGSVSGSCSDAADSTSKCCNAVPPGWGFLLGKALHTAGTLLDLHINAWQQGPPAAASAGEGDTASSSDSTFMLIALLSILQDPLMCFTQLLPDASMSGSTQQQLTELARVVAEALTAVKQSLTDSQEIKLLSSMEELMMGRGGVAADTLSDLGTASSEDDELPVEQLSLLLSSSKPQLGASLISLGNALCAAMPTKAACNYPGCFDWEQPSEALLVGGKGKTCSKCRVARYCCVEHRAACRALAEAAAATAAAAASAGPVEGSNQSKKKKKSSKVLTV